MKTVLLLTTWLMYLGIIASNAVLAKGWKGITPLHSNRTDVERILGVISSGNPSDIFKSNRENVILAYTLSGCSAGAANGWRVPKGTVVSISVFYKQNLEVADFLNEMLIDQDKLRTTTSAVDGSTYYYGPEEGVHIVVQAGKVRKAFFYPSIKDEREFSCAKIDLSEKIILPCIDKSLPFDPSGTYYVRGASLSNLYCVGLTINREGDKLLVSGAVYLLTDKKLKIVKGAIIKDSITFTTERLGEIEYSFTGRLPSNTGRFAETGAFSEATMLFGEITVKNGKEQFRFPCSFTYKPLCE